MVIRERKVRKVRLASKISKPFMRWVKIVAVVKRRRRRWARRRRRWRLRARVSMAILKRRVRVLEARVIGKGMSLEWFMVWHIRLRWDLIN